jgi:hypothetical protein
MSSDGPPGPGPDGLTPEQLERRERALDLAASDTRDLAIRKPARGCAAVEPPDQVETVLVTPPAASLSTR